MERLKTQIKGVNLGNWLVLEKWMNPVLFAGTTADDEYYLAHRLDPKAYEERLRIHRSEYITERDFAQIRALGLNAVRIPVPYFVFGDRPPFLGCIEELDNAFSWAEHYGLKILLELHSVPGSQNGRDSSGLSGVCSFFQMPEEMDFVLGVLERLARRYGKRSGLLGIEPLDNPVSERTWMEGKNQKQFPPEDPAMAQGSRGYSPRQLKEFYRRACECILPGLAPDKFIVIQDSEELSIWKDLLQTDGYENVMLDVLLYLTDGGVTEPEQNVSDLEEQIEKCFVPVIEKRAEYFPVICGECSLFNSVTAGATDLDPEETLQIYRTLDKALKAVWEKGSGYFYWSWKAQPDLTTPGFTRGWDAWDLGKCAANGWFAKESSDLL